MILPFPSKHIPYRGSIYGVSIFDAINKRITDLIEEQLKIIRDLLIDCKEEKLISCVNIETHQSCQGIGFEYIVKDCVGNIYLNIVIEGNTVIAR